MIGETQVLSGAGRSRIRLCRRRTDLRECGGLWVSLRYTRLVVIEAPDLRELAKRPVEGILHVHRKFCATDGTDVGASSGTIVDRAIVCDALVICVEVPSNILDIIVFITRRRGAADLKVLFTE